MDGWLDGWRDGVLTNEFNIQSTSKVSLHWFNPLLPVSVNANLPRRLALS